MTIEEWRESIIPSQEDDDDLRNHRDSELPMPQPAPRPHSKSPGPAKLSHSPQIASGTPNESEGAISEDSDLDSLEAELLGLPSRRAKSEESMGREKRMMEDSTPKAKRRRVQVDSAVFRFVHPILAPRVYCLTLPLVLYTWSF